MHRFLILLLLLLPSCERLDITQELKSKKQRLSELSDFRLRGEVGPIGHRTSGNPRAEANTWMQISLDQPEEIDLVVLVPTIRLDSNDGLQADGFPEKFDLIIQEDNGNILTISKDNDTDSFLPRIAPLVIPLEKPVKAKSVRVVTRRLTKIGWSELYFFSLSEIMLFSGERNIALHQTASSSSVPTPKKVSTSRSLSYLTDGHLPYGMDTAHGKRSVAYLNRLPKDKHIIWEVDLGKTNSPETIRFHRIEVDDTFPRSEFGDFAMPSQIKVKGSLSPDFSNPIPLLTSPVYSSIYEIGPVMSFNLKKTDVRYLRLELSPGTIDEEYTDHTVIGFSEIEVYVNGENLIREKPIKYISAPPPKPKVVRRFLSALTDGRNYYGNIIPEKSWIKELALRHELEKEIPLLEQEVLALYSTQKKLIGAGTAIIIGVLFFSLLVGWWLPKMTRKKLKERFAADVHDELGANLHTISFISDELEEEDLTRNDILEIKDRIRFLSQRAGRVIYHMTDVLVDDKLYRGLIDDMKRAEERVLSTHYHTLHIEGEEHLPKISKKLQIDILLFYQECLVNIGRHSTAERFETNLIITPKTLTLTIRDFGSVPEKSETLGISKSLQRRARLLRGKIDVSTPKDGIGGILVKLEKRY